MLVHQINPPVLAFFLVVVGGWIYALVTGDWLAVTFAIVIAIVVGDVVHAIFSKRDSDKSNRKRKGKK